MRRTRRNPDMGTSLLLLAGGVALAWKMGWLATLGLGGTPPGTGGGTPGSGTPGSGTGLSFEAACATARSAMGSMDARWLSATCQEIQGAVCNSGSQLFTQPDQQALRTALCAGYREPVYTEPPAYWQLPDWSYLRPIMDSQPTNEAFLAGYMPQAPYSYVHMLWEYFLWHNATAGYSFPVPSPYGIVFEKWLAAGYRL